MATEQLDDRTAQELLEILEIQASAHMVIAEEFVNVMDLNDKEEAEIEAAATIIPPSTHNNVVAFPARN